MTTVRTPVEGFTGEVVGVQFVDGVGDTDNESAIAYFTRHGYQVGEGSLTLSEMTVKELVAYAGANDIDLDGATKKAEVLAVIEAAERGDTDNESGDDPSQPEAPATSGAD